MKFTFGWPNPKHSIIAFTTLILGLLLFFIAAHESGSGFVQIVGAVLFAAIISNSLISFSRVRHARITVTSVPYDGTTNHNIHIGVTGNKDILVTLDSGKTKSAFVQKDKETIFSVKPSHCGLYKEIDLIVVSSYPFGLITFHKKVTCHFPTILYVAPEPTITEKAEFELNSLTKEAKSARRNSNSGNLKSIVEYQPGDSISAISWSKTAQMQQLLTKTHEAQTRNENYLIEIRVPERADPATTEHYLGERLYLAVSMIERNGSVTARIHRNGFYQDFGIENILQIKRLIASLA